MGHRAHSFHLVVGALFAWSATFGLSVRPIRAQPLLLGAYSGNNALVSINPTNGLATPLFSLGLEIFADLAYDPNRNALYGATTSNNALYRIDLNAGSLSLIGQFPAGVQLMHGLEYDSINDVLYGITNQFSTRALYRINVNDASSTLVGVHGIEGLMDLAFDPVNDIMYASESFYPTSMQRLRTINLTTGATTVIGDFNVPGGRNVGIGLAYHPQLGMLATDNGAGLAPDALYKVNPSTGQATFVGFSGLVPDPNLIGLTFIPEPGSGAISICAVLIAGVGRRRRVVLR